MNQDRGWHTGAKSSLPPVFINKVLLKHSHAHTVRYCLWLLLQYNSGVAQLPQIPYGLQCVNYLLYDSLQISLSWSPAVRGSVQIRLSGPEVSTRAGIPGAVEVWRRKHAHLLEEPGKLQGPGGIQSGPQSMGKISAADTQRLGR